jgi:hypothetical protein
MTPTPLLRLLAAECCKENRTRLLATVTALQAVTRTMELERKDEK